MATKSDQSIDQERIRRVQRGRNIVLAAVLAGFAVLTFAVTIVKLQGMSG